jgi:hypothetical protein
MDVYQSPFSIFLRTNQLLPCRDRDPSCPDRRRVFDKTANLRQAILEYESLPTGPIPNCWYVSRVTDFNLLLEDTTAFNDPIGNWDMAMKIDARGCYRPKVGLIFIEIRVAFCWLYASGLF